MYIVGVIALIVGSLIAAVIADNSKNKKKAQEISGIKEMLKSKYPMEYARLVWFQSSADCNYLPLKRLLDLCDFKASLVPGIPSQYAQLSISQDDFDFLAKYAAECPEEYERFTIESAKRLEADIKARGNVRALGASLSLPKTNQEIQDLTFGKQKEKSAAGAMVKGAVVGGLIGGDAGAVVGAMVA
ncbi:MAG: hypothetical protein LBU77_03710, partial [Clostridiales bacterium]|nr:hypothetical protein [Clostridiales bacterium]